MPAITRSINKYGFVPNPKPRYVLKRETKPLVTEAFSTFDIEWEPGTYVFRCAAIRRPTFDGAATPECIETYTDLDAFVQGLFNPAYQGTVYAHNAGKGDLLVILRNLLAISKEHRYDLEKDYTGIDKFKAGFDFELMVSCNVPIIASVTDRRKKWKVKSARRNAKPRPNLCWRIVDSVRTWPAPLSKIAASMGMAKKNDYVCEGSRPRTDEEEEAAHVEYVREHYAREHAEYVRRVERQQERASKREARRASQVPSSAAEHLEFYHQLMDTEQRSGKPLEEAYELLMQERAEQQARRAERPSATSNLPLEYNPSPPPLRKKTRTCGHEYDGNSAHCVFYAPLARTVEYCAYDAEILYQFIYRLQAELHVDNIQLKCTAASIAMNAIKRNCLPEKPIPIDVGCNATSRKAYTGGRVEPLFRGRRIASKERPLYQYDIASAYPFAMTFPLPGELVASGRGAPPMELPFIALCEVSVPLHLKVPPLPLKLESQDDGERRDRFTRKATDAIVYPVGSWASWYTSVDITALVQAGGEVTRWFRHYAFEPFELQGFAQTFYAKKAAAKETGETFREALYKLLLNSGYGKLCEDPIKDGLTTFAEAETYDTRYTQRDHKLAREIYRKQSIRQSHHEHVPAGAFITSYVRACLWGLADQCLKCAKCKAAGIEVEIFYFDTDSLTTTCAHASEFTGLRDGELGSLKLEHEIYDLHIAASKVYAYLDAWNVEKKKPTTKVIAKGFAGVRELPDYQRIVMGQSDRESGEYTRDRHAWHRKSSLSTLLDTGELRETVISREFKGKGFPKRNYHADGTSVPWHVDEAKKLFFEGWDHLGDEALAMADAEAFADAEYER